MVIEWINMIAGLVLLSGMFHVIPGLGKYMDQAGKWLGGFQVIIGILAIIFGILNFGFQGIIAIIAGLVLAAGIFPSIPGIGKSMEKAAKWLGGFQTIIGIVAFVFGLLAILGINLF